MKSEATVQSEIRLAAAEQGVWLGRNNVFVAFTVAGRPIRGGLANDSSKLNAKIKSADLIGITPVKIRQKDVGKTIGVFTSIEVKREGWECKHTSAERAQGAWLDFVRAKGGLAYVCNDVGDIQNLRGRI